MAQKRHLNNNISLVPLRPEDAVEMFPGLSDEKAYQFIPDTPPDTPETLRERYQMLVSGGPPDAHEIWLNWVIRYGSNKVAAGYTQATITGKDALIGYHVFPAFWRKGIGSDAVTQTLENIFDRKDVTTARAFVDTRNTGSISLLEKLGFFRTNTLEKADFFKGQQSNEYEYILKKEIYLRHRHQKNL